MKSRCGMAVLVLALSSCGGSMEMLVCDPPCPVGTHCAASGCQADDQIPALDLEAPRDSAADCPSLCVAPAPYCGPSHVCVPCLVDSHCPVGTVCRPIGPVTACVPGCADDARCGGGSMKCCNSECIDSATDGRNCGVCGKTCLSPHAGPVCTGGQCVAGPCAGGWADCNADSGDGCETNLRVDPSHCTACDQSCARPHGIGACSDGCYLAGCEFGFDDCNSELKDGCEVAISSDIRNCGRCANVCVAVARAQIACSLGACLIQSCSNGYGDCNRTHGDGCEVALATDASNCGACGLVCAQGQVCSGGECTCPPCNFPNAVAACIGKQCAIASCKQGFADCDGKLANGCEQNIGTDRNNCGACGKVCAQGLVCANGGCTCPQCNIPNARPACVNNVCVLDSCLPGYADCDKNAVNGCEVSVDSDSANCGLCGTVCGGQTPFCLGGVCSKGGPSCNAILMAIPNAKSGVYTIDPDGNGGAPPFSAYCDMTTAGGGWTMVLNLDTSDGNVMWWANPLWENTDPYGDVNTPFDGDHKSPAWSSLSGAQQILLLVHEQGVYRGWKQFRKVDARTMYQAFADNKDNTLIGDLVLGSDTANIAYQPERLVRISTQLYANHCTLQGGSCTTGAAGSPDGDRIGSNEGTPKDNDGGGLGNWTDMNYCCVQYGHAGVGQDLQWQGLLPHHVGGAVGLVLLLQRAIGGFWHRLFRALEQRLRGLQLRRRQLGQRQQRQLRLCNPVAVAR